MEFSRFLFWCLLSVFQLCLSSPDRLSPSDPWRSLAGSDQGSRWAMECFFHCMRYSSVQIEQWGGTPSCSNTTVFILTALLPLYAGMKLLHNMLMYRSESNVTRRTSPSSKNYGSKMLLFPTAHHTVVFSTLRGLSMCSGGCSVAQNLTFCLFTWPLKCNYASSLKRRTPKSSRLSSIRLLIFWAKSKRSVLLACICTWKTCILLGSSFKLWGIICYNYEVTVSTDPSLLEPKPASSLWIIVAFIIVNHTFSAPKTFYQTCDCVTM